MTDETAEAFYHATIMDRARRPRYAGRLEPSDASAEARNPLCGDRISLQLTLGIGGRVNQIRHQARACAICAASADLMAEMVPGLTTTEIATTAADFEQALRRHQPLPAESPLACFQPLAKVPSRISCATLGWTALLSALKDLP
ncbi:Fe-S cluster assembly sulfur transfer protein SufU [Acidisoma sp. 7E03]